ncbi:hypothetical protein TRIUR3_19318 [Triticum urartu]|uniref:Uncharacterized protein n=1 Tax=Triticum urartu TaxID=4572 RepID=M7ZM34_TRIUA|nr:hypothetical protein TRIUR3_19318 [Triticum urartu]
MPSLVGIEGRPRLSRGNDHRGRRNRWSGATSAYDRWTEGEPSSSDPLSERQMRASELGDPWLRGEPGEEGEGGAASAIVAARPAADQGTELRCRGRGGHRRSRAELVSKAGRNDNGAGVSESEVVTLRFARQVVAGRWFMALACLLILSASGATYAFGIYSTALKSSLGYDQCTLNTLAFFKDLGSTVAVSAGLLNEVAPPSAVLAVGAAMNLTGYLMVYLVVAGRTTRPPLWLMCAYVCAGANSQSLAGTGALITCVKSFPGSGRGVVLGLLKGYVGLSGAILTQLYLAIYGGDDSKSILLLIAWLPAAVSVVFLPVVRVKPPPPRRNEDGAFFCFLYISVALASYILVMIVVQKQSGFSHAAYAASATALLILLTLPLLSVLVRQEYYVSVPATPGPREATVPLNRADDATKLKEEPR